MLSEFLLKNENEILALTENKTRELAGEHLSSAQLKEGLPIFFKQVVGIIQRAAEPSNPPPKNIKAIAEAADQGDEPAMAEAAGQPLEAELARTAGQHGKEMLRLGYNLSHVVHAYGAICQAVTEIATQKNVAIKAEEFHALNRSLDVAIAGAVTTYEAIENSQQLDEKNNSGALGREMRAVLSAATTAFHAIKSGTVGIGGSTGLVLENSLKKLDVLASSYFSK